MPRVADDIIPILTKFHREVVLPDIQRIVGESEQRLRNEIHDAFDALAQRLDRLETEYQMLVAGLKRVEESLDGVEARLAKVEGRLGAIEQRLDRVALKAEVQDLKARVEALERRIAEIDADL
jgi:predicted  nucleic acid-binding Zn-ribbon protein